MPVRKPNRSLDLTKAEPALPRRKEHDWDAARDMFVLTQPLLTLAQVSKRTGIDYVQLRRKAAKEKWKEVRLQEQARQLKERRQNFLQKAAKDAISFDETSIDVAKLGQGIIAGRLVEISKLLAAAGGSTEYTIDKLRRGEPLERGDLFSMVNYKELASLAQAALMFQEIGRKAFGQEVVDGLILKDNDNEEGLEKVVSIGAELSKDDPARLASFIEAMERAGLTMIDLAPVNDAGPEDTEQVQVLEGEILPPLQQIEAKKEDSGT